jgi:catechol 2,3-dioxygenase-like lactoylglutathione lyase family enzyme
MTESHLGVRHAALTVSDLPRSLAFYTDTLGFEPAYVTDTEWAMVSMAGTTLSLIPSPHFLPTKHVEGGAHPAHLGIVLATTEDVDAMHRRLAYTDVPELQSPKRHRDGSYGFYLTDPDGNALECIFIPYRLQGAANPAPTGDAIVLLVERHGDAGEVVPFQSLLAKLQRHAVDTPVALAYLVGAAATLSGVLPSLLSDGGIRRVRLVPAMLSMGAAVAHELRRQITVARAAHPGVEFTLAAPLGENQQVQEAMTQAIVGLIGTPSGPGQ